MNEYRKSRKILWSASIIVLIAAIAIAVWMVSGYSRPKPKDININKGPVPQNIAMQVNFPVFYPQPNKLPAGYSLNLNSFKSPVKNGVTYFVTDSKGQKLVFSLQPKPSDTELQSFNANYIPLRDDYQTPVGKAEIGAYNNHGNVQTLVSLPTTDRTWIIATAPYEINQDQLKQVLSSLRR